MKSGKNEDILNIPSPQLVTRLIGLNDEDKRKITHVLMDRAIKTVRSGDSSDVVHTAENFFFSATASFPIDEQKKWKAEYNKEKKSLTQKNESKFGVSSTEALRGIIELSKNYKAKNPGKVPRSLGKIDTMITAFIDSKPPNEQVAEQNRLVLLTEIKKEIAGKADSSLLGLFGGRKRITIELHKDIISHINSCSDLLQPRQAKSPKM